MKASFRRFSWVVLVSLLSLEMAAQGPNYVITSRNNLKAVRVTRSAQKVTLPAPTALYKIFDNLGPNGEFNAADGWLVAGPLSVNGSDQFIAVPFTPAANAHVTKIKVAVGYLGSGTNQFRLTLNSDDGTGLPGPVLATKNPMNAPTFGQCCAVVTVQFPAPGLALLAGTQYWVVAATKADSDFFGAWAFADARQVARDTADSGWQTFSGGQVPAVALLGTKD